MSVLNKILAAGAALFIVAGLASSTAGPGAAAAASASAAISRHTAEFQHGPATLPRSANDVSDWTGYVDTACSTCHLRYVNANFKVPTLNCANSDAGEDWMWMSMWAGLDGDGDSTVEQVGVQANCTSFADSSANYFFFYEMAPDGYVKVTDVPVTAGDSVSVSVYYDQSSGVYQFTLENNTTSTGTAYEATCPVGYTCENKTAEVIAEVDDPGPPEYDLPDFGTVTFSGTTVTSYDGTKGDLCGTSSDGLWTDANVHTVDIYGQTLSTAGSTTTCSGPDGFTATYEASGPEEQ